MESYLTTMDRLIEETKDKYTLYCHERGVLEMEQRDRLVGYLVYLFRADINRRQL